MLNTVKDTLIGLLPKSPTGPKLDLGPVVIESKLLETPLSVSYLGTHVGLNVPVVVRVMHPEIKPLLKDFDRLIQESRSLGRIRHANIAGVLDVGEIEDHAYMVLEYIAGVPLVERIKHRPLREAQALALLIPVAEGLSELWRNGLVHRAVSPHIIHIQQDGDAKLDMTILRRNYAAPQFKQALAANHAAYWSPEEIRNQPVDASSDMWSFGATLYHTVTGKLPFPAIGGVGQASMLLGDPVDPRKANPEIHEPMSALLLKMMSKNYEDRFLTAEAFLAALRSVQGQISGKTISEKTIMLSELELPPAEEEKRAPIGIADVIGNCKIVRKIGAGAFGVVYLARHKVLDIDVAVKILPMEAAQRDPGFVDMFLREARTAARIRDRNVIGIFEAGVQDGQHYIIMELAPGGTVAERMFVNGGKLPPVEAESILLQAARGLQAAERLRIIHRDIKPDNLMFSGSGELKIADLGLAKRLIPADVTGTIRASLAADQLSVKGDNAIMAGTPAYMAPEMAVDPEKADTRADLYSLGVTAYHMLTGKLPFEGKTTVEVIMKHVLDAPTPPHEIDPGIPAELSKIIMRLMEKKPEQRFQSAAEVVRALEFRNISEGLMATF